ncbi:MAG: hypothetical protein ACTSR7_12965 [Promethearchaeota archaeon]
MPFRYRSIDMAAAAQISFGIAYGEYGENATSSYGVADEDLLDLQIGIAKVDDGVLLGTYDTNGSRYFSQVVDISETMNNETLGYDYYGEYQIGLLNPNSKTLLEGQYQSTYSFQNDEDGSTGTDISFIARYDSDGSSAHAKVFDEINCHKNVTYFYDGSSSGNYNFYAYHDFDANIDSGTIEFWVMGKSFSANDKTGAYYHFGDTSGATYGNFNSLFHFGLDNDNDGLVRFYTANGWETWSNLYQDDTWHHVRIDFESTTAEYLDLDQYELNFWFDGEQLLENSPFAYNDSLGQICTASHGYDNTRRDYLDAMAFSWDPNYDIGDNIEEFINPYVFLNPGDYISPHSFDNELEGTSGTDIDFVDANNYPTCEIVSDIDDHKKALKLTSDGNWRSMYDTISEQDSGTLEWWVRAPISYCSHRLILYDGATQGVIIYFHNDGKIYEHDGSTDDFTTYEANTWTHVRVDFECGSGAYKGLTADKF